MNPFSPEGGYPSPGAPIQEKPAPIPVPTKVDSAGGNPVPPAPERTDQAPTDTEEPIAPEPSAPTAASESQPASIEGDTKDEEVNDSGDQADENPPDVVQSAANAGPAPSGPANPSQASTQTETVHVETEVIREIKEEFNQIVDILLKKYGMEGAPIDQWGSILDDLNTNKKIPSSTYNALKTYARILKTERAIKTKKENTHKDKAAADAKKAAQPNAPITTETFPTDDDIEREFGKAENGQYYTVTEQNEVADPNNPEVMYLGQTYDAFIKEMEGMQNTEAQEIVKKLKSMLTRSIQRPDVYIFDTSPNKELKRNNDLNHSAKDAVQLLVEEQLHSTDKKPNPAVGRLTNLLVLYDQAEADPKQRRLLSGLIYDELRHLDRKKLIELGNKDPKNKEAVDKILRYRSENPQDPELAKTQETFNKYLEEFDGEIDHLVRTIYGNDLANNLKYNLSNNRGHTISMFLCAHTIENSEFITRDETGHIVLKHEYDTQLNEIITALGFDPAEKQMIVNLALSPGTPLAILNTSLGIDGNMLMSETGMEEQAQKASKIIVERARTDSTPLISGIETNQTVEQILNSDRGKAIMEMMRFNMGPNMHIDEQKLRKLLGKGFGTAAMGLLLLWQQIMGVLSTDENTLAPNSGGQQRH